MLRFCLAKLDINQLYGNHPDSSGSRNPLAKRPALQGSSSLKFVPS